MSHRFAIAAIALSAVAACSHGTPTADAALKRDLDLARGQGLELAPQASGRATLSADELIPAGNRSKATATRPATANRARPLEAAAPETKVAESQAPAAAARDSVAAAPATPRPSPTNAVSPAPPGGYKTMGELIRKAPFPINP